MKVIYLCSIALLLLSGSIRTEDAAPEPETIEKDMGEVKAEERDPLIPKDVLDSMPDPAKVRQFGRATRRSLGLIEE